MPGKLKLKCTSLAAFLAVSMSAAAVPSAPVTLVLDMQRTSFWRTAIGGEIAVCWEGLDPEADSATLEVRGCGFSATYPGLSETFKSIQLPECVTPYAEDVYSVTVTFDTGRSFSERIGRVAGASNSGEVGNVSYRNMGSSRWGRYSGGKAVLPIPYGTVGLSVDGGSPVDTGLNGAQGWYMFGPEASGSARLALLTDSGSVSATVESANPGIVFTVR